MPADQRAVDRIFARAMEGAPALVEKLTRQIVELVDAAESLQAVADRLPALYLTDARRPLAEHLATALSAADAIGMASVRGRSAFGAFQDVVETASFPDPGALFRGWGFRIAGVDHADLLASVKGEVARALDRGMTLADFRKDVDGLFDRYGVSRLHPWHLETVYRTNMQRAFGAAKYRELSDPEVVAGLPYWRYVAVLDARTRPSHRALHGKIYRADDPVWQQIYPPWDFNCRCDVQPVSESQMTRRGWAVEAGPPDVDLSSGFGPRGDLADLSRQLGADPPAKVWEDVPEQPRPGQGGDQRIPTRLVPRSDRREQLARVDSLEAVRRDGRLTEHQAMAAIEADYKRLMGIAPRESVGFLRAPDGSAVQVDVRSLAYAMQDRREARERWIPLVRDTIEHPYEINLVAQQRVGAVRPAERVEKWRRKYIGLYGGPGPGVVVTVEEAPDSLLLWNFFPVRERGMDEERRAFLTLWSRQG